MSIFLSTSAIQLWKRESCGVGIHLVGSQTHSSATRSFSLPLVCSAKGTSLCHSCWNRHMIQGPRSCRTKWHFHTAASLSLSLYCVTSCCVRVTFGKRRNQSDSELLVCCLPLWWLVKTRTPSLNWQRKRSVQQRGRCWWRLLIVPSPLLPALTSVSWCSARLVTLSNKINICAGFYFHFDVM